MSEGSSLLDTISVCTPQVEEEPRLVRAAARSAAGPALPEVHQTPTTWPVDTDVDSR